MSRKGRATNLRYLSVSIQVDAQGNSSVNTTWMLEGDKTVHVAWLDSDWAAVRTMGAIADSLVVAARTLAEDIRVTGKLPS